MNRISHINSSQRQQGSSSQQVLYDYLVLHAKSDSPEQLIEDFRRLFVEGRSFRDSNVYIALESVVKSKNIEYDFNYFFNRCCHILINRWQMEPQLQTYIPKLVELFENLTSPRSGLNNTPNRIRYLVKTFTKSDEFIKLQRLARVITSKQTHNDTNAVGNLIHRYPYLYNHCLAGDDSSTEHQQTVRRIKAQTEKRFEVNLSRYVTYKVRMAQLARSPELAKEHKHLIRAVQNPTLLKDKDLNRALKYFVGTIDGGYTYKSLSQDFLSQTIHAKTFEHFKGDLYEYLTTALDPQYTKGQFNKNLYQLLQNTLPECNHQKPSEFLMMRTSSQLLNFLVVDSGRNPEHYVFIDMISNLGVTKTIGTLLQVVLMCRKVKPYLDKRFSILFNHYESFSREGVPWLVKALEHLQLAFSVHFGKVDLTCLNHVKMR
ncbi:MAG TPA: hypothetical protein DCF68_15835 [Cyanothece sp. UBA12306]|nr:hypothetical protein [Cyanothece sp. UBA12306]